MASVATYGGYTFADNEVNLVGVDRRTQYSPRGKRLISTVTHRCSGELIYADTASIVTKIQAVESALKNDGNDFTYTVGGTLAHSLRNSADCISGVRVVNYSFPTGDAAQLATTRSFSFTLQAKYNVAADDLVAWQESIEVTGTGGPLFVVVNTMAGVQTQGGPVAYTLAPATAQYYHQYGQAIGFSDYPVPTPPINSQWEFGYRRRITNTSGTQQGTQIKFYKTSWSYYMVTDPRIGKFTNTPTSK